MFIFDTIAVFNEDRKMSIDMKSKIPEWMLVDNSVKSTVFCLSMAMMVIGFMLQFIIRISFVAESAFFFPLYFLASMVLFTLGCVGAGVMTLVFIWNSIKAVRHGVFIPWITDCIQDLNERPKLKLDQHIIDEQNRKKLEDEMNIAINKFKKFEAKIQKDTTQK